MLYSSRSIANSSSDDMMLLRSSDAGSGQNEFDQVVPSDETKSAISSNVGALFNSSFQQAGDYLYSFFVGNGEADGS